MCTLPEALKLENIGRAHGLTLNSIHPERPAQMGMRSSSLSWMFASKASMLTQNNE